MSGKTDGWIIDNPNQIVLGLGEVGAIIRRVFACYGHDPLYTAIPQGRYPVMHVIFPYDDKFVENVLEYQRRFEPELTIIHSTVRIGTTRQIPHAVHSPVNGRWNNMEADLMAYDKWIGANSDEDNARARDVIKAAGMKIHSVGNSDTSEAAKLLCLARYGVDIAFSHYAKAVLEHLGGSVWDFRDWTENYNSHVAKDRIRPVVIPHGEHIGGHCVCPVTAMLAADYPHPFLNEILRFTPPNLNVWPFVSEVNGRLGNSAELQRMER